MNRSTVITFAIPLMLLTAQILGTASARADTATNRVAQQFREYYERDNAQLPRTGTPPAMKYLTTLSTDGSWPDLNYNSKARSAWEPGDHLSRTLAIINYARAANTPPAEAKQCIAGAHRALGFWIPRDFKCPNWWFNDIGGPQLLGNIGIMLNEDLQPDELKYMTETAMARSKVGSMTGQNRVWLAGVGVMRAVLTHDDALLQKAADVIMSEIRVTEQEGIQPDWSFHQHGPQQQFGNYGEAFAAEEIKWAIILRGTPCATPADKLAILQNYLLQGEDWVEWKGTLDISACGRQLFPGSPKSKAAALHTMMQLMATVDPANAKTYLSSAAHNVDNAPNDLIGTQLFWRSDYLLFRQPDWMVSLKMASERVIGGETVNTENLSGLRLADGATFIYHTGHEYDDIFPAWDWRMIPGTTEALDHSSLTWTAKSENAHTAFVGGASDGTTAVAAMDFHRDQLQAKKAWFFDGVCVVCLGAGINSTGPDQVVTTVDQSLLIGPVIVQQRGKQSTPIAGSQQLTNVDWIEQAGTRYVFLTPQKISLSDQPHTGNWHTVFENPASPKADVTKNIFALSIDHGAQPHAATYAYGITSAGSDAAKAITILANTETLQAVKVGSTWSAAIFWTAGSADLSGLKIEVDQPCTILVHDQRITIADPTHKLKSMKLSVSGRTKTIDLPQGGEAGKSITMAVR